MTTPGYITDLASRHGRVAAYAFTALALLMPVVPQVLPLCLVAGLVGLAVHHRAWKRKPMLRGTWTTAMPWALALYLLHVAGVAWSSNMDYALFDLQVKLPLALLPLVFFWTPQSDRWRALFAPFVWGNLLAVGIALATMVWRLCFGDSMDQANEVFGERFSWLVHPSYFALYLCVALAAVFLRPVGSPVQRVVMAAVLCLGILLCGSKAGWAGLGLVLAIVVVARWRERSVRNAVLGLAGVSLIGLVVLVAASPNVRERVVEAWRSAGRGEAQADASTSSEVRKLAWNSAAQVARANTPWGTGTGDVKDAFMASHEQLGYIHLVEKRINAHCQYLQLWAALGWAGLGLTILVVLVPLLAAVRGGDALAAVFFLLTALNWAVESMIEVQAGALFFAFFAFVLAGPSAQEPPPPTAH